MSIGFMRNNNYDAPLLFSRLPAMQLRFICEMDRTITCSTEGNVWSLFKIGFLAQIAQYQLDKQHSNGRKH
jgi:hypothetical protein